MKSLIHSSQPLFSYPISFSQLSFQFQQVSPTLSLPLSKPCPTHHKPCPAHHILIHFFFFKAPLHLTSAQPQNDELHAAREAHWCAFITRTAHLRNIWPLQHLEELMKYSGAGRYKLGCRGPTLPWLSISFFRSLVLQYQFLFVINI